MIRYGALTLILFFRMSLNPAAAAPTHHPAWIEGYWISLKGDSVLIDPELNVTLWNPDDALFSERGPAKGTYQAGTTGKGPGDQLTFRWISQNPPEQQDFILKWEDRSHLVLHIKSHSLTQKNGPESESTQSFKRDDFGQDNIPTRVLQLGSHLVTAELATTLGQRALGLSHRKKMSQDRGMLFIWPHPGFYCMWMRGTTLPLTALFLDEKGRILSAQDMSPGSEAPHCPPEPVRFILEVSKTWPGRSEATTPAVMTGLEGL